MLLRFVRTQNLSKRFLIWNCVFFIVGAASLMTTSWESKKKLWLMCSSFHSTMLKKTLFSMFCVAHHHRRPEDTVIRWCIMTDFCMYLVAQLIIHCQMIYIAMIWMLKFGRLLSLKKAPTFHRVAYFIQFPWSRMQCTFSAAQSITMFEAVTCIDSRYSIHSSNQRTFVISNVLFLVPHLSKVHAAWWLW